MQNRLLEDGSIREVLMPRRKAKSVRKIRAIANVRSSLTMIVAEKDHSVKQIEEERVA
jgi:hypothetical protein